MLGMNFRLTALTTQTSRSCAYHQEFSKEKLLWSDIVQSGRFAYDDGGFYCQNTVYLMTGERLKYLSAILNSSAISWYFQKVAPTSGMGTLRWMEAYVEKLPIPQWMEDQCNDIVGIVDQILQRAECSEFHVSESQVQIDSLVNSLFGFDNCEISVVRSMNSSQ